MLTGYDGNECTKQQFELIRDTVSGRPTNLARVGNKNHFPTPPKSQEVVQPPKREER